MSIFAISELYCCRRFFLPFSLCYGATSIVRRPSVRRQIFPSNDFLSRTTWPISTKLGRKHASGMGIQTGSNKGAGPFWGTIKRKIRKILIDLQTSSSHEPLAGIHWYLAWVILGARSFKFVQMMSLGSCVAPPQLRD